MSIHECDERCSDCPICYRRDGRLDEHCDKVCEHALRCEHGVREAFECAECERLYAREGA